jgi:hypothetical protein
LGRTKETFVELKDFIKETLQQIVEGVVAAQKQTAQNGAAISPANVVYKEDGQWNTFRDGVPQDVEFDVGLTSTGKRGTSEGVGVFLGSINLGKKNESGSEHIAVTRVKFSVTVLFPSAPVSGPAS